MADDGKQFEFLVERAGNGYAVSSNDGDGRHCWDLEDVKVFMHEKVRDWYQDLREVEQERLESEEENDVRESGVG